MDGIISDSWTISLLNFESCDVGILNNSIDGFMSLKNGCTDELDDDDVDDVDVDGEGMPRSARYLSSSSASNDC